MRISENKCKMRYIFDILDTFDIFDISNTFIIFNISECSEYGFIF